MRKHYVEGKWVEALSGRTLALQDPATGDILDHLPFGDARDYIRAVETARLAGNDWSRRTPHARAEILKATAALIRERLEAIAHDMVLESGKPLAEAKAETAVAANFFEWFAEEGKRSYGRVIPSARSDKRMSVIWQPMGVVGAITAWNFPVYNPARCWSAILAAGCTLVARSSEHTPLSAMHLMQALHDAGLPPGVANFVHGEAAAAGQVFLDHPAVRKSSFTGSTAVGKQLMDGASRTHTSLALEMGGNAPAVICPDVDPAVAAQECVRGKFRNAGQVCIAPQRFLVQRSQVHAFLEAAKSAILKLQLGNGLDAATQMGPLIHERHRQGVVQFIEAAVREGAVCHCGGEALPGPGFFLSPCLIETKPGNTFHLEEVFGPVMVVTPYDTPEEALALANGVPYGLAAYVMTRDLNQAVFFSECLEAGIIGVNEWLPQATEAPFGGWKASGIGSEGGSEGLYEYMERKLISIGSLG